MQKNLNDFANAVLSPQQYYAPYYPRVDDPLMHLVVDKNLQAAVPILLAPSQLPFFFPYVIRRDDPNAALILQRNLEELVKAV